MDESDDSEAYQPSADSEENYSHEDSDDEYLSLSEKDSESGWNQCKCVRTFSSYRTSSELRIPWIVVAIGKGSKKCCCMQLQNFGSLVVWLTIHF